MDPIIMTVIVGVIALLVGIFAGKLIFNKNTTKLVEEAQLQADRINAEAEQKIKEAELQATNLKEKKALEAKEHFLQLKTEHEKQVMQRTQKLSE